MKTFQYILSVVFVIAIAFILLYSHSAFFLSSAGWQNWAVVMSVVIVLGVLQLPYLQLKITMAHLVILFLMVLLFSISMDFKICGVYLVSFVIIIWANRFCFPILKEGLVLLGVLEAGTLILQYFCPSLRNGVSFLCGHFDNPAGFAAFIVAIFPFVFIRSNDENRILIYLRFIYGVIMLVAVMLSGARSGILAMFVIVLIEIYRRYKKYIRRSIVTIVLLVALCLMFCVGLFYLKPDSANGRLLVWRISIEMLKEKPFMGHGIGSFQSHYMEYQAKYLSNNPDISHVDLASDVKVPFNEYLKLLVECGVLGISILLGLFSLLYVEYRRSQTPLKIAASLSFVGVSVFAFFSYPTNYFIVVLIMLIDIVVLCKDSCQLYVVHGWRLLVCKFAVLLLLCDVVSFFMSQKSFEKELYNMAHINDAIKKEEKYSELFHERPHDYVLLYNYGAYLNDRQKYGESNVLFVKCLQYFNNSELQLYMCDNYLHMGDYFKAFFHAKLAEAMVPARFYPLYYQFLIAKEQGNTLLAEMIAEQIVMKEEKVENANIKIIKLEMERFLKQ